jgi:tetratricopeptide (TPR) repeat protein
MDRRHSKKNAKSAESGRVLGWTVTVLTVLIVGIYGYRHSTVSTTIATYKSAWVSTNEKASEIEHALEENTHLRYENANLRLKLETADFEAQEKEAAQENAANSKQLEKNAGSRAARSIASIAYKPPTNLLPSQMYTLGVTYFKAQENEKAAVIFSFLTQLEDNAAYRTARNYVMTGVSWYRLSNFEMADHYFDLALKEPEKSENLRYQAQARLWRGVIAQNAGKPTEAQYWLRDLLDHHPQSTEAGWVNSQEADRATASKD